MCKYSVDHAHMGNGRDTEVLFSAPFDTRLWGLCQIFSAAAAVDRSLTTQNLSRSIRATLLAERRELSSGSKPINKAQ